jgi:hypothetical protein
VTSNTTPLASLQVEALDRIDLLSVMPEEEPELPEGVLVQGEDIETYYLHSAASGVWIDIAGVSVNIFLDGADVRVQMHSELGPTPEPVAECHAPTNLERERRGY